MKPPLDRLRAGHDLTSDEARAAFESIVAGGVGSDEIIAEFLQLLANKGETIDEIVAAAETLGRDVVPVRSRTPRAIGSGAARDRLQKLAHVVGNR